MSTNQLTTTDFTPVKRALTLPIAATENALLLLTSRRQASHLL